MFIGREKELQFLNDSYESDHAELIVLYGRRRVGKTELITEFCKGKPNIFYSSKETTDQSQLGAFSRALISHNKDLFKFVEAFNDWETAFSAMGDIPADQKLVVVIDEFPYMVKSNKSIPSVLQNLWDHLLKDKNIMLILSGSSMSFIEKELLGYKNPLYGRTTGIYKLEPLPYTDAIKFFPDYSDEDKLLAYAILGGIPHYLKQFNPKKSLEENIKFSILRKGCTLYNEVEFLLHEELREPSTYNTIIEAVALGNTEYNAILTKTQIEQRTLSVYLKNLTELGIIEKEFPALSSSKEKSSKSKGLYQLTDNFFRFWYSYAYENLSFLEINDTDAVWESIEENLHDFASKPFENVCIGYMYEQNKRRTLPFRASTIARWWGKVTRTVDGKKQTTSEEIDILVTDKNESKFILAECKFTNAPFDLGQLRILQSKNFFHGETSYYLFSLNGFTPAVQEMAQKDSSLVLVSANDILSL